MVELSTAKKTSEIKIIEEHELELDEPIEAHGETVHVLTIKRPLGKDIMAIGMPFRAENGVATVDMELLGQYVSRLAHIPPSSVHKMGTHDFLAAATVVQNFFEPSRET